MKNLQEFRITPENVTEELPKLLHSLKPEWKKDQIEMKKLSGGYSCLMYHCFEKASQSGGVTVRAKIYSSEDLPNTAEPEAKILQVMNDNGLFPEILAIFQNGFCYNYIQGTPIYGFSKYFKLEEPVMRLMARKLAEIHSVKVEYLDYSTPTFFQTLHSLVNEKYPADKLPLGCPSREELIRELTLLEKCAVKLGSPIVLCHGDPHPGNIVQNNDTGMMTYVDWEVAHINYQAFDLGYALQVLSTLNMELPTNYVRKYLRYYLERWLEIQGNKDSNVTEDDIDKLEVQADVFRLCSQLMWMATMVPRFPFVQPSFVADSDVAKLYDAVRDQSGPTGDEAVTSPEYVPIQFVVKVFKTYLGMKDDILANCKNLFGFSHSL